MATRTESNDYLSIFARPALATHAKPVDTFVRPGRETSKGGALGTALESLNSLTPALAKSTARQASREITEGEEMWEKNRSTFAEGVRNGDIPAGASPYVRKGYRKSQLHALSANYAVELNRAMEGSAIHEEEDPAKIEAFIRDFTTKFEDVNGLSDMPSREVDKFYRPTVINAQDGFRAEQANRNINLMEERRVRSFEQELLAGLEMGRGANMTGWINEKANEMYLEGIDHDVIEQTIVAAVGQYAMDRGSVNVASMLNGVEVAGMGRLGRSTKGRAIIARVKENVAVRAQRGAAAARRQEAAELKVETLTLERLIVAGLLSGDPESVEADIARLAEISPTKAYTWDQRGDSVGDDTDTELSEANLNTIVSAAIESGDADDGRDMLTEALKFNDVSMVDYQRANAILDALYPDPDDDNAPDGIITTLNKSPSYKAHLSLLRQMALKENLYSPVSNEDLYKFSLLKRDYLTDAAQWQAAHRLADGTFDEVKFEKYRKRPGSLPCRP